MPRISIRSEKGRQTQRSLCYSGVMGDPFKLKKLRMSNFRSFSESEVNFYPNGMTLIRGHNLDTGGSSYAGKTSIPLAISYALGFLPFSAKDQKKWGSDGPTFVELEVTNDEGTIVIRAGDKPSLTLPSGRKVTGAAPIKEELAKYLQVNPEVLAALTYQQQGERSRFLAKTDAEKKEFLSNVMPWLVRIEEASEVCEVNLTRIRQEVAATEQVLAINSRQFQSAILQEPVLVQLPKVEELKVELSNKVSNLQTSIEIAQIDVASFGTITAEDTPEMKEKADLKQEAVRRWNVARKEDQQRIQFFNQEVQRIDRCITQKEALARTIPSVLKSIESLESNKCPTCEQFWNTAPEKLAADKETLRAATEARDALKGLSELKKVAQQEFLPEPKIAKLESIMVKLDNEISQLKQEQNSSLNKRMSAVQVAQQKLHSLRVAAQQASAELSNLEHKASITAKENEHRVADYQRSLADKNRCQSEIAGITATLEQKRTELKAEQDFQEMIGRKGFLGSIFEEVLREISEETNKILASVANTAHVTLNFVSDTSTLKGKVNKTIQSIVTVNGNVADFQSGCSGGMRTSVGIAVDLAVATVISRRTNTWPGWLCYDEGFEGLDQVSKETVLEMLKKHAADRLVMVIDHTSEVKEYFSSFIDVEFSSGNSNVAPTPVLTTPEVSGSSEPW